MMTTMTTITLSYLTFTEDKTTQGADPEWGDELL